MRGASAPLFSFRARPSGSVTATKESAVSQKTREEILFWIFVACVILACGLAEMNNPTSMPY